MGNLRWGVPRGRTFGNEKRPLTNEEVPFSLPPVPQTVYKRMVDPSLGMKKTGSQGRTGSLRTKAAKNSGFTQLCRKGAAAPHLSSGQSLMTETACLIILEPA